MPLKNWCLIHARCSKSIPYISEAFFPSLKQNFIAYCSSKVSSRPDCIFEIHQLWKSGFSRVYSNCCCSCSFKCEIIKIGQSSHKMYSNNTLYFQESMNILNACTKKNSGNLLKAPCILFIDYLEKERTINSKYYIALLVCLKEEITKKENTHTQTQKKQKKTHKQPKMKKKLLFHQDNAPCHKLIAMMEKLHELPF